MADVNRGNRPLSPHLSIYRMPLPAITSILIRITGIACYGLGILVVAWFLAAAGSERAFEIVDGLLTSFLGDLVMFGAAWALWYHMLGRLRHVIWDLGYAVEIPIAEKMSIGMLAGATVLALFTALVV